jgi:hypothetical protein
MLSRVLQIASPSPGLLIVAPQQDRHSVFWTERDLGIEAWSAGVRIVCKGAQVPVAGDGGEDEDAFHPGEALADALAAAGGKREIGEFGPGGFVVEWEVAVLVRLFFCN